MNNHLSGGFFAIHDKLMFFIIKYLVLIVFCITIHIIHLIQRYSIMAITVEQIHATADQLASQGIKPTQTNVREALGGGSFTTIAQALKTWRTEQETVAELQAVVIPQDITDRTQVLIAQVWETAQTLANDRLKAEREALAHKEALLIADNDEMQKIVATLENEQSELLAQLDQLTAQNTQATADKAELLKHIDELNRANIQQRKDLQALNDKLLSERELVSQVKDKLDHATADNTALTATNATLTANLQSANDTIERLQAELTTAKADTKATADKAEIHLKDLASVSGELANLQGQNKTLNDQIVKLETLTATQTEKIEKLTADLATAKAIKSTPKTPNQPKKG